MTEAISAQASVASGSPPVKRDAIRLAMLGMVEGNGHPYSWSAICNGYDAEEMMLCPYTRIPAYLDKEPKETLRIEGAVVTHIWTDDPADAVRVSRASLIPNVVERPEEVIGHVDAVVVATDKGHEHVERCRSFVEAGIPVFVDKPLADNEADLITFTEWVKQGKAIMSSSSMRYSKEFAPYRLSANNLGGIRFASITTPKTWERYGIHALESVYPIFGAGFLSVRNTGTFERNIVHLKHAYGADIVAVASADMFGSSGLLQLCGTAGHAFVPFQDTFYSFKAQLQAFVDYVRTGVRPYSFDETIELMKMIIAGIISREQNGREVWLTEIAPNE
ncbi:Gfo/Idh/MocA family oxidoreductase [Paenibacillus sp. J5C_2022]|uniref:Gfo/Idh/MocA family oxidoreductase n=1 Tax=Paenibacillus sp. J5C2022 TaxID=2977129 RepID=UPI0021D111D6|nr:Gfo/Idh/MocA family oxidoreductase [Paenibacillus sp. J5C2022]MCU6711849.1 Gfo/Idh/MocA family oxidoreductase [Paenibacillus sp. J5C2022]